MKTLQTARTRTVLLTAAEIRERGKHRAIVIEAHPTHAAIRLKGTRTTFLLSWEGAYHAAARAEAERLIREKRAAKKAKRSARA